MAAFQSTAHSIGSSSNFHISTPSYIDLTRSHPSPPPSNSLLLPTSTTPVLLDPAKTALVVIDMQNFFLSPALGRKQGAGHRATQQLAQHAVPAARKAGIRVVWLNWGLTDSDIETMPPSVKRAFGDKGTAVEYEGVAMDAQVNGGGGGPGVIKDKRVYRGLGAEMGMVEVDGKEVDAGRVLMRDQWNAALFPPLDAMFDEGRKLESRPDVWLHKDRMSGMWGGSTICEEFLEKEGIQTLLFAGVNTDQCVSGTLTDSFSKGYDCILLSDGCGTTSPPSAQECIEYNAGKTWGWLSQCASLVAAVDSKGPAKRE